MPVVLVTHRESDGSARGLALTARTRMLMGDFEEEGAMAFAIRPLHWGGPVESRLSMIHAYPEVKGSQSVADTGLHFSQDLLGARSWLQEGEGSSLRFRFFLGQVAWKAGELDAEIKRGTWLPVRCAREAVLDESLEERSGRPLWTELLELAGDPTQILKNLP
mmetsp:Transcript_12996/g.30370  ORF Transcript_12996/g.30370 Transcript_12996/m.30370 type:complete len:163 (+) Transcript_12996:2-490(+)